MSEEAVNEAEKLEQSSSMTHLPEQSFEACRSRDSTYRREQATARVTTALSLVCPIPISSSSQSSLLSPHALAPNRSFHMLVG